MPKQADEAGKRRALQEVLRAARVPRNVSDPPVTRILDRVGVRMPPPVFSRFHHCLAYGVLGGILCGVFWGLFMSITVWRGQDLLGNILGAFAFGAIMGAAFTLLSVFQIARIRKRLGLPDRWEDWNPPPCDSSSRTDSAS